MKFGNRGGIELRIVFIGITLLVIALVLTIFLKKNSAQEKEYHRKAVKMSDMGFQRFMEASAGIMTTNPEAVEGIAKTEYRDGWFEVLVTVKLENTICEIVVTSEGTVNKISASQKRTIVLEKDVDNEEDLWVPRLE